MGVAGDDIILASAPCFMMSNNCLKWVILRFFFLNQELSLWKSGPVLNFTCVSECVYLNEMCH